MAEPSPKDIFIRSLNRCLSSDEFIPKFYERFLGSSEEIKDKFKLTDFEKQNKMLQRSLELCAGATSGDQDSLREMNERAETHNRYNLNIEPHFYDIWFESLIANASDFDDQWDDTIEKSWRRILGHVVQFMVRKY